MSLILTLGHAYAVAIGDLKKAATFVETKALPALQAVKADAPTVEAITALVCPQLANVERVGEAVLGVVIQAIEDAGAAAGAGGGVWAGWTAGRGRASRVRPVMGAEACRISRRRGLTSGSSSTRLGLRPTLKRCSTHTGS